MTIPTSAPEIEELIAGLKKIASDSSVSRFLMPADLATIKQSIQALESISALHAEKARLLGLLNTPHTDDWFEGVRIEAGHQIERFGVEHDAGKTSLDWFWLIGYLAQKAATYQIAGDGDKAKHHTISTAAALLNWHRNLTGESRAMRPGIDNPMPTTQNTRAPKHADGTRRMARREAALTASKEKKI